MRPGRLAWTLAVLAAACYVGLWWGYARGWAWVADGDEAALRSALGAGTGRPGWVEWWTVVSAVLGPTALRVLAAVAILVAVWRRRVRTAVFLAVTVMGMGLVTVLAKALADRPRPATALAEAAFSAFPSGHALGITVAVLAFVAVLPPRLPIGLRYWAALGGAAAVLLVGVARVALNVHHPSDVLAGWALGYLWFLVCLTVVPPDPRYGARRSATP